MLDAERARPGEAGAGHAGCGAAANDGSLIGVRLDDRSIEGALLRVARSTPAVPRRVLLLQGPAGPFFHRLALALDARGTTVDRVRFNPGDVMFCRAMPGGGHLYDYREGRDVWADWLDAHLRATPTDAIVLFGAERPQHSIAREVAGALGVPIVSLEEGYVRSGYVTVERGANNWRSPLAGKLPPGRMRGVRAKPLRVTPRGWWDTGFWWMVRWGWLYFGWRNLAKRRRQSELFHKSRPSLREVPLWLRNAWRRLTRHDRIVGRLLTDLKGEFDLVPLQVADDAQLADAARGWSNRRLIVAAIASFAAHAPAERHLVFKVHPLERGHTSDHRVVRRVAAMHGVADRVHCIMSGPLGPVTRAARGMIVINSTSGLTAIAERKPLLVLGNAIYRNPALARCGDGPRSLDPFWTDDYRGDERVARHYQPWLIRRALVPGDYYHGRTLDATAAAVADRTLRIVAEARAEAMAEHRDDARDGGVVTPFRPRAEQSRRAG